MRPLTLSDSSLLPFDVSPDRAVVEPGEAVHIRVGPLSGVTGTLVEINGNGCLTRLTDLGEGVYARLPVDVLSPIRR